MTPDPCPLCGGFTSIKRNFKGALRREEDMGFAVICINPDCAMFDRVKAYHSTPQGAVDAWNREVRGNG